MSIEPEDDMVETRKFETNYDELIEDIRDGLVKQGYSIQGGSSTFCILDKVDRGVKVFLDVRNRPREIVIRYYWQEGDAY